MGSRATPSERGDKRGAGDQLQPGNVPCPRPRSQGSGYPVPRQPEPGMAFQAQAFLHPAGLGARGGGRRGGLCLPWVQAGGGSQAGKKGGKVKQRWERGGGCTPKAALGTESCTPKAALGARQGLRPQSSAGGRGLHPDSRSPAPRRGYSGQCPRRQHCRRAQGARDAKRDQRGREMLPAHSSLPAGRRVAGTCPESGETSRDGSGGAEGGNLKTEQQPRGWGRSLALLLL